MRTTTLRLTKSRIKRGGPRHQLYYCVTIPKPWRGRTRRFFAFTPQGKREAQTFLLLAKRQQSNYGTAAFSISDALRTEAVQCSKKLGEGGYTLTEATNFFLAHIQASAKSISVSQAVEQLISSRKSAGLSDRYCQDLRLRLGRFAKDFEKMTVATITAGQINRWLAGLAVAPATRNTFRRDLRTLFSYCEKHNYCQTNEAKKTDRAKEMSKPPRILTVEETTALLNACDDGTLPYAAISLFGGLRASEVQKLDWSEVDLESGHIEITAAKSKISRRRLVPISDNLVAWIQPLAKLRGPVVPSGLRKSFDAVKTRAGFHQWPQNVMRHSYGSYRLAQCHDVARVSLEMGNSPQMVFAHYRELVRPKQADQYWKISPTAGKKLVRFATATA
jgi:integrase